jgi:hypothetical protein
MFCTTLPNAKQLPTIPTRNTQPAAVASPPYPNLVTVHLVDCPSCSSIHPPLHPRITLHALPPSSLHPSSPTFTLHPSIRPPYLHPVHSRPLLHRIRSASHGSSRKPKKAPPTALFMQAQEGPSKARTSSSKNSRLSCKPTRRPRTQPMTIFNFRTQALLLRRNRRRRRGGATSCFVSPFSFLPSAAPAWGAVRTNETNNSRPKCPNQKVPFLKSFTAFPPRRRSFPSFLPQSDQLCVCPLLLLLLRVRPQILPSYRL